MRDTPIYTIGGAVQAGSGRYIARQADQQLLALCREGAFVYILAARQMGKSSLMLCTAERLAAEGICSVQIDLSLIGTQVDAESWYFGLLFEFRRQLGLKTNLLDWWQAHADLGPTQRFSLFCEEVLLREIAGALVIFVDEIDTTLSLPFTDDFYAAIRGLYLGRAQNPELARLSFVLIGVATPGDLVRDPKRTPFNIGQRVEMTDFSFDETLPLADGLGLPENAARQTLRWVLDWTGGHPYLTQRLCQAITDRLRPDIDALPLPSQWLAIDDRQWRDHDTPPLPSQWETSTAQRAGWPGGEGLTESDIADITRATFFDAPGEQDHNLQFVRDMLTKRAPDMEGVLTTYRVVRRARRPVPDEEQSLVKSHLKLSGVVRRERSALRVRNRIYRTVFDERWISEHLPVNWALRLRQALRVIAILLALALSLGGLAVYALVQQQEAIRQRQAADAQAAAALAAQSTAVAAQATSEARRLEAERQSRIALSRELAANAIAQASSDPQLALLLALDAERVTHTDQAEAALRQVLLESQLQALLHGHTDAVRSAAFSPDGRRVVTASADGTAQVWDSVSGTRVAVLRGHGGAVVAALFSPDDTRVVTASADGTAQVWDAANSAPAAILRGHTASVNGVAFSPDGKRVVTASADGTAQVWDAASGAQVATLRGHTGAVVVAIFSPDGALVLTASDDATARIWDATSGVQLASLGQHISVVSGAAFSPDGQRVVTASYDGTARIWETRSGTPIATLIGHNNRVYRAAFSPDGAQVVTASRDGTARLWDAATGRLLAVLQGHTGELTTASFSPDGARVVTASVDGTARVWDAAGGRLIAVLRGHSGAVVGATFDPAGAHVVTASADGTARVWDANPRERITVLRGHSGAVNSAAFSPNGEMLITAGADLTVLQRWSVASGRLLGQLSDRCACQMNSIAFSSDGAFLATADNTSTVEVWRVGSWEVLARIPTGAESNNGAVAFSPDGIQLVTAGPNMTAQVWDVRSGRQLALLQGHTDVVNDTEFSPDGAQIVTASADGSIRVWDARSSEQRAVLTGHVGAVNSVGFSPDGARLVTAGADGTAQLWDVRSGASLLVLRGHTGVVNEAAFSPDGKLVISASEDGTARIWETASGNQIALLTGHTGPVKSVAFSPDGTRAVTAGADRTARIYRWELYTPMDDVIARAQACVTRDLTCAEQQQYLHTTNCTSPIPTTEMAAPTAR